jgi:hypothetical protein
MLDMNSSAGGGNGRGRRTLGLTNLRSAQRWYMDDSGSGGLGRGPMYVGESSSAAAHRGTQSSGGNGAASDGNGDGSDGNGAGSDTEAQLVPFPLFDGVFMFTSPSIAARGRRGAGRGVAGRGAPGRGGAHYRNRTRCRWPCHTPTAKHRGRRRTGRPAQLLGSPLGVARHRPTVALGVCLPLGVSLRRQPSPTVP